MGLKSEYKFFVDVEKRYSFTVEAGCQLEGYNIIERKLLEKGVEKEGIKNVFVVKGDNND